MLLIMADGPKTENVHVHHKNGGKNTMKKNIFNLQLFDDGGEGGSGAQGGNAGNGNGGQGSSGGNNNGGNAGGGFSFAQAEEIANARAQRAEKAALSSYFKQQGMSETEIEQAIADFKKNKAAQQPNVSAIEKERDEAKAELQALKDQATLRSKGVRDEDLDYVQFKVSAMMKADDKLDFEKAVTKFLKDNPRFTAAGSYRVKTGTDGSQGSGSQTGDNASINNAIRRAAGHRI